MCLPYTRNLYHDSLLQKRREGSLDVVSVGRAPDRNVSWEDKEIHILSG
jgi:hypothetical protein